MRRGPFRRSEGIFAVRTLIVGDIHGCIDELFDLIEAAGLRPGDRLISLGDIVNKGPAPEEVFDFLTRRPNTLILRGNHEARHLESAGGDAGAAFLESVCRAQFSDAGYRRFLAAAAEFPLYEDLPEALVVHGYFEAGLPLERQKPNVLMGRERGRARLEERGLWPWYEHYEGPKPIIVGHKAYGDDGAPMIVPGKVYAIDTKCCEGGALTGLLLPGFEIISVPARRDHWRVIQMAWGSHDPAAAGRFSLPRLRADLPPIPAPVAVTAPESGAAPAGVAGERPAPAAGEPGPPWAIGPLRWAWRLWRGGF